MNRMRAGVDIKIKLYQILRNAIEKIIIIIYIYIAIKRLKIKFDIINKHDIFEFFLQLLEMYSTKNKNKTLS